ncbi:S-adenosylmethionine decarboxylase [Nonomuraea jabiensis]|uniref:S-adenosylmethionine decarboxylase n=1 Tax=Nonomuraea jabiensis TaxID=882448 RepID=UPI0036807E08
MRIKSAAWRIGARLSGRPRPHGATCVLVLTESHIIVSTWPECGIAHIEVFTCRAIVEPSEAIGPLLAALGGQIAHSQHVPCLLPEQDSVGFAVS